jgi:hypothetical protein
MLTRPKNARLELAPLTFFNGAPMAQTGQFESAPSLGFPTSQKAWRKSFAPFAALVWRSNGANAFWPRQENRANGAQS